MIADWNARGSATLDLLCRAVQLNPAPTAAGAPDEARLWTGRYAAVLCWPASEENLGSVATTAEGWFADFLLREEKRTVERVVDGYLLIALPKEPSKEATANVSRIELSTQICRKHIVWPEEDGEWLRFDGVTVLGLPEGETSAEGEPTWPRFSPEQEALWAEIQKSPARAAQAEARRE